MNHSKSSQPKSSPHKPSNLSFLLHAAWAYDKSIFPLCALFTIFTAIQPFLPILFPRWILDELTGTQNVQKLALLLASFFLSAALVGYLTTFLDALHLTPAIHIRFGVMRRFLEHCMTTDYKNTENPAVLNQMEAAMKALNSNDVGVEGILHKLFSLGGNLLAFTGYITIIGFLNPWILLFLITTVSLSYFLTLWVQKYEHSRKDDIADADRRSSYAKSVMNDFSFGKEVRVFSLYDWISKLFLSAKNRRIGIVNKVENKRLLSNTCSVCLMLLREGVVYGYLIFLFLQGHLTIGAFTMYFATIAAFAQWMKTIADDLATIHAQSRYVTDLRSFLDMPNQEEPKNPLPKAPFDIEFRHVSFKYPGSDTYVYQDISLKIPAGQRLAIVGHNGAGKTTFIKLLCRLYEPDQGEILINGVDVRRYQKQDFFSLFSVVFQEIKMTAFSVAENVSMQFDDQIDREKVALVLQKADIAEKINSLQKGMDTAMMKIMDEDGIEFSGGQNQKIALARAMYKDAGIMILDEPTAALDAIAEQNIYMRFNEMVGNKTAIYISHRLASTHFCDQIALFEQGKLVEYGSHEVLLAQGGKYAQMFQTQAQYYQQAGAEAVDAETVEQN